VASLWTALPDGVDPAARVSEVRRAHDAFVATGTMPGEVLTVVAASWRRSARAHVAPDATAPIGLCDADLDAYRTRHPLAAVMPVVRELVGDIARDSGHLLAVCDADGRLLWVEGHPAARRRADRMNFVAGAQWAEADAGTNAPGTAVAVDHAVQIFATEHFCDAVQRWTCAAAPVHDPRTGRLLGAIDITGGNSLAHPHSLAFVQAVARAAEAHLALLGPDEPAGPALRLTALGRDEALLVGGGHRLRLSPRHSEILVLLAHHPEGLSGDELILGLYDDEFSAPVTLRAELSRLRRLLGSDLLDSRPYRLLRPVDADFLAVTRHLDAGATTAALAAYAGPLLPASRAPGVIRLRRQQEAELRAALTASQDPDLLAAWTHTPWGADDRIAWQALTGALPAGSPRRIAALARLADLDIEYGLVSSSKNRALT
jgi:hypothetical protein